VDARGDRRGMREVDILILSPSALASHDLNEGQDTIKDSNDAWWEVRRGWGSGIRELVEVAWTWRGGGWGRGE